jgi:uncharacterized protein
MSELPFDRRTFLRVSAMAAMTTVVVACSSDSTKTSEGGDAVDSANPTEPTTLSAGSSQAPLNDSVTSKASETPSEVSTSSGAAATSSDASTSSGDASPVDPKQFQSLYVPMRDGVRIAIDVWIPAEAGAGNIPTVVRQTRYQRATRAPSSAITDNSNFAEAMRWMSSGFAFVVADARGTGASFGARKSELSDDEIKDYDEILTWIGSQPWSNKRIGTYGTSYDGDTAELVARHKNPYLKAVAPLFNDFDPYRQLTFPGGVNFEAFRGWSAFTQAMDGIDGAIESGIAVLGPLFGGADSETIKAALQVAPVQTADGETLLKEAIREHQNNQYADFAKNEDRDLPLWNAIAISTFRTEIEASEVPMFIQVGWPDAATSEGTLERFTTFRNSQEVWIGPWRHSGNQIVDYARPTTKLSFPDFEADAQFARLRDFFKTHLRDDTELPSPNGKRLHLSTNGSDGWIESTVWPVEAVADRPFYMLYGGKLLESPQELKPSVLPNLPHTTGTANRWTTNVGLAGEQDYSGWTNGSDSRVAFTTEPFKQDTHILGFPVVSVDVTTQGTDGALFAYLEKVTPDGSVLYITEGMLRLSRRGKTQPQVRTDQRLDRTFATADNLSMTPAEPASVVFQMVPTSTLFEAGSRLQLSFATTDTGNFASYATAESRLTVTATGTTPTLVVPILSRP